MELTSAITEGKHLLERFEARCEQQMKEPVNLRIGQWKLVSLRNGNEEIEQMQTEPGGPAGGCEVDQHMLEHSPS